MRELHLPNCLTACRDRQTTTLPSVFHKSLAARVGQPLSQSTANGKPEIPSLVIVHERVRCAAVTVGRRSLGYRASYVRVCFRDGLRMKILDAIMDRRPALKCKSPGRGARAAESDALLMPQSPFPN